MRTAYDVLCAPSQEIITLAGKKCTAMDTDGFETWKTTQTEKKNRLGAKKNVTEYEVDVMTKKRVPTATSGSHTRGGKKKKKPQKGRR